MNNKLTMKRLDLDVENHQFPIHLPMTPVTPMVGNSCIPFKLPTSPYPVSIFWNVLLPFVFMCTRVSGIVMLILLMLDFFKNGDYNYFAFTLGCFILSTVITTSLLIFNYFRGTAPSYDQNENKKMKCYNFIQICNKVLLSFLFRKYYAIKYAVLSIYFGRSRHNRIKQKDYYDKMITENSELGFIQLFERYIESAPVITVQITIILQESAANLLQKLNIPIPVISLAIALATYKAEIRNGRPDKKLIEFPNNIFLIIWHVCFTLCRIVTIALVASVFPLWTFIACLIHVVIVTMWIYFFGAPKSCQNKFGSFIFSFVIGFVYVYNFIPTVEGRTRYKYIIYYILCGAESVISVVIFLHYEINISCYHQIAMGSLVVSYLASIFFQSFYYLCCHPK